MGGKAIIRCVRFSSVGLDCMDCNAASRSEARKEETPLRGTGLNYLIHSRHSILQQQQEKLADGAYGDNKEMEAEFYENTLTGVKEYLQTPLRRMWCVLAKEDSTSFRKVLAALHHTTIDEDE